MDDSEVKEFEKFMKKWALKKMRKLEKKLHKYAAIYFGEPVAILYAKKGSMIVHKDGSESRIGGAE